VLDSAGNSAAAAAAVNDVSYACVYVDVNDEHADPWSEPGHGSCYWQHTHRGPLSHEHGATRRPRGRGRV